jgi:hypothetical protein
VRAVHRLAVDFAPRPDHSLWVAGCNWLGRDPRGAGAGNGPAERMVRGAWHRGFHATLRPPMALIDSARIDDLVGAVQRIARRHAAFALPRLEVGWLSDFLALRPLPAFALNEQLQDLADDCVLSLEGLRAPLPDEEHRQRLALPLDPRQLEWLDTFGCPSVLDRWDWYFTLSDSVGDMPLDRCRELRARAIAHFSPLLAEPLWFDALTVSVQARSGSPFETLARVPLSRACAG